MKNRTKVSGWAAASLILGLSSFLVFALAPAAIITGCVALRRIRRSPGVLKGVPLAAGGVSAAFLAMVFAALMAADGRFNYCSFNIPTDSMAPTIKARSRIVADLGAYRAKDPARGDIVVYELLRNGKRRLMCKRIVGLPGEEVEIRSGKVFSNGLAIDVPGLPKGVVYLNAGSFGKAGEAAKVPAGAYYTLGDNPQASFDSRQHGPLDRRDIKGKYLFAYRGLNGIIMGNKERSGR